MADVRPPVPAVLNQLLIRAQRPDATYVAGYHTWLSLGRHVRKGERGIAILVPSTRRIDSEDSGEEQTIVTGFRVVFVFDASQTDGAPPPSREMPPVRVPDLAVRTQLITAAETAGFTVSMVDDAGNRARSWFTRETKTICLVG